MCGILGLIDLRGDDALLQTERGARLLEHRGPDRSASWSARLGDARVALGHRRLSILDLSPAGAQPMLQRDDRSICPVKTTTDGARLAMVYNGEIYNYVELRDELRGAGHRFTSEGDTEVLLAAYRSEERRVGKECRSRG